MEKADKVFVTVMITFAVCCVVVIGIAMTKLIKNGDNRLDRIDVEGVDCVVTRDGLGRPKYTDCDWGSK